MGSRSDTPGEPPPGLRIVQPARLRTLGPLVALLVPFGLTLLGVLVLALWPCSGRGCVEPALGAWLLVLFAVPTAVPAGIPWFINPITVGAALLTSLALWMTLGSVAARRTAREPDAGWSTFAGEMAAFSAGIIAGVLLGFVVISFWIRI